MPLLRLPTGFLRRRVRRNRLATQLLLLALLLLLLLPLSSLYSIYKPPTTLIRLLRHLYPDVLFDLSHLVPPEPRLVALTIDDAPSSHTAEIASILAENEAHATFFVIGSQVDSPDRRSALRNLVLSGHELANHAMRDEPSTALPEDELVSQVKSVQHILEEAYDGVLPNRYFRPGSGFFNERMRWVLGHMGYSIVLGSVYPHDAQVKWPRVNARHVLSMVRPGAIIVCHDRRAWTPPMLRIVLPELKRRGYSVVTVTELVKSVEER